MTTIKKSSVRKPEIENPFGIDLVCAGKPQDNGGSSYVAMLTEKGLQIIRPLYADGKIPGYSDIADALKQNGYGEEHMGLLLDAIVHSVKRLR